MSDELRHYPKLSLERAVAILINEQDELTDAATPVIHEGSVWLPVLRDALEDMRGDIGFMLGLITGYALAEQDLPPGYDPAHE